MMASTLKNPSLRLLRREVVFLVLALGKLMSPGLLAFWLDYACPAFRTGVQASSPRA